MNNSDKVYPQVDNIPDQVYHDWLYPKGGKLDMINTNNYSQNRGSEVINKLTDYSYNVNMYEEIRHYYNTEKYTVFPQIINNSCGKSIN